jgi:osmotically inducible protein OsmC
MKRHATLVWKGTGKEGEGSLSTESKVLSNSSFNYLSRFSNGEGTNPEELLAAAHVSCFTMKIAFMVNAKGCTAEVLDTRCDITMENDSISASHLSIRAKVPGLSQEDFTAIVNEAKEKCMVTRLFNLPTTMDAVLEA